MPTRNVTLPDHLNTFLDAEVAAGHFPNADETVCAALQLLEREQSDYQAKAEWLRQAAQQGIDQLDRGEGIQYESLQALLDDIHTIGEEIRAEAASRAA